MRCTWTALSVWTILATLFVSPQELTAASWNGAASPLDGARVVVVRATDFRATSTTGPTLSREPGAADGQAVEVGTTVAASLKITRSGKYTLWVRSSVAPKLKSPVKATLLQGEVEVLEASLNQGEGKTGAAPGSGGQAAYEAYAKAARLTGAEGKADQAIAGRSDKKQDLLGGDDLEKELLADLDAKKGIRRAKNWTTAERLEELKETRPFYWWNAGTAELKPGQYTLRLAPEATSGKSAPALVDMAFLTTSTEIVYPWLGDIDAPKASYIRFRIDELPEGGATISAGIRVHYEPWSVGPAWLNPSKLMESKSEPHTQTGFTRWYRLQDIERAPPFGAVEGHLSLQIRPVKPVKAEPKGATQFAVFPHEDYVLREISWNEPEGTNISFLTDFETHLHKLRTLRDHAREDYDKALAATGGRVFPLTRGPLYFGNAWGAAGGGALDYMAKTLRLLGFNSVGQANEALEYRKLYGWTSHAGEYWPPVHMPFNERESIKAYDDYYSKFFSRQREFYEGVSIFQLADEPGEISRVEMTAPFWRFVKDDKPEAGGKWVDAAGDSELSTRRVDLGNCVLEGQVEQHGTWIGFRVATDKPGRATKYAYWNLGAVSQNREVNVAAGRESGKPGATPSVGFVTRPGAVVGRTPTEFKIVYDGESAALFIKGKLVHQHTDLNPKGGFAIVGPVKAVNQLKLRTIRKDEHLTSANPDAVASKSKPKSKDDLLDDLDELSGSEKKVPDWAKAKPLEAFVREDWVFSGGMPEAHAAFRVWAKQQGLTPELFGQKAWDEVRMLTVSDLVESPADARLFYWSRKFSGYLTPKMFALSADAIRRHAPNPEMQNFVALSGHALYFPSTMPLDMFQLASASPAMMPGVSDWMSYGSWRWDCHQAVAYSVAMYNAGARRPGKDPVTFPMMHCVWPNDFRSYTMLANQVKYVSFYNFGPSYAVTEGHWNDAPDSYVAVHRTANRASQCDDILATAKARPSRVALLYSIASEYWNPQASFADKRALFLGLSHDYYQPELVTEDQVAAGELKNYDALFVLDPIVAAQTQEKISDWVKAGGLLVATADAAQKNEFNEPLDLIRSLAAVDRTFVTEKSSAEAPATPNAPWPGPRMSAIDGQAQFRAHAVSTTGMPKAIQAAEGATLRASYDDGRPAWIETTAGQGRVVYFGHRLGLTYTAHALRRGGFPTVWADTARAPFIAPLAERKVERELTVSHPLVMSAPLSNDQGTVAILYNMHPRPLENVTVTLKEAEKPASVDLFSDDVLVPVDFSYDEGRIRVRLPELVSGQMVVVRKKQVSDNRRKSWGPSMELLARRVKTLQERTVEQLGSTDRRALSCGAFFAGSYPEWNLSQKLVPLLKHADWEVRRAAAEALGRCGTSDNSAAVADALATERDAHVIAELYRTVSRLAPAEADKVQEKYFAHPDGYVRGCVVESLSRRINERSPDETRAAGRALALLAIRDADLRVRTPGITLLAKIDSNLTVQMALAAYSPDTADALAQPAWATAIGSREVVFSAFIESGGPANRKLLLAVAAQRSDPKLCDRLIPLLSDLATEEAVPLLQAAVRQRAPSLSRAIHAAVKSLPPQLVPYVPLILEHTFDARLGEPLADWDEFLRERRVAVLKE